MQKNLLENNAILKLSFDFSLMFINYCELLDQEKKFIISKQLLCSATSIGANAMEAQNAEGKSDFIHKIKISPKEADETSTGFYYVTAPKNIRIVVTYFSSLKRSKRS